MHICNGNGFVEDEEGVDLPDQEAARATAIASARDVMMADVRNGELDVSSFIEVEDEQHHLLFTLAFYEAVEIKARHDGGASLDAKRRG